MKAMHVLLGLANDTSTRWALNIRYTSSPDVQDWKPHIVLEIHKYSYLLVRHLGNILQAVMS